MSNNLKDLISSCCAYAALVLASALILLLDYLEAVGSQLHVDYFQTLHMELQIVVVMNYLKDSHLLPC